MIGQDLGLSFIIYTGMEHGTKMEQYAKNMYKYRVYTQNRIIANCPYLQQHHQVR